MFAKCQLVISNLLDLFGDRSLHISSSIALMFAERVVMVLPSLVLLDSLAFALSFLVLVKIKNGLDGPFFLCFDFLLCLKNT